LGLEINREWAIIRLRQAIDGAYKIKAAANAGWIVQKADQLIEAANSLLNVIEWAM
jgi:hypothetical protein